MLKALILSLGLLQFAAAPRAEPALVLASTTSTEQSGLFAHLLPRFTATTGIAVKVVALGTGQALDLARRGDADLVLVHDPAAEQRFVAEGWGLERLPVMSNDFVLVGPKSDPAQVRGADMVLALQRIAAAGAGFVSRGDKSGTHAAELRFWKELGPAAAVEGKTWYRACGCGMGPALNMAAAAGSYLLADRGTWLSFKNRADLQILVEGDARLRNPYAVIVVNPQRHPHIRLAAAQRLAQWLRSEPGQQAIASYRIGGEGLFFPLDAQPQPPKPAEPLRTGP